MSAKHPTTCEWCHEPLSMQFDDARNCYRCENCDGAVAVPCPACGGEGMVYEDDYNCDWINDGHDFITCPECNGKGWTADPSFQ